MTEKVKRKLNGAASKMLATITGRTIQEEARNPFYKRSDEGKGQKMELAGHVLRMPEHRLVRQVLLNCARPTRDAFRRRTKYKYRERKLWSSNRPSTELQKSK